MLSQFLKNLRIRAGKKSNNFTSVNHGTMREHHLARKHAELCRQARHQQHFYGWRTKCD